MIQQFEEGTLKAEGRARTKILRQEQVRYVNLSYKKADSRAYIQGFIPNTFYNLVIVSLKLQYILEN